LATADTVKDFFNGKDLSGWTGDPKLWKVENGEILGHSPGIAKNEFLKSQIVADDFRLTVKVKLVPNKENSGIQFRSEVLPNGDVRGYRGRRRPRLVGQAVRGARPGGALGRVGRAVRQGG
jgi:hypothetical protein